MRDEWSLDELVESWLLIGPDWPVVTEAAVRGHLARNTCSEVHEETSHPSRPGVTEATSDNMRLWRAMLRCY